MNDTPRTDAAETAACAEYERTREAGYPPFDGSAFDTARALERENNDLRAKLVDAEREINALTEWGKSVDEKTSKLFLSMSEQLDTALARAEAAEKERDEAREAADTFAQPIYIRCLRHLNVRQQNENEITLSECGGCIAEERDTALAEVARLRSLL